MLNGTQTNRSTTPRRRVSRNGCNSIPGGSQTNSSNMSSNVYSNYSHSPLCLRCNRLVRRLWMDLKTASPTSSSSSCSAGNNNNNNNNGKGTTSEQQKCMIGLVGVLGILGIVLVVLGGGTDGRNTGGFLRSAATPKHHHNHHSSRNHKKNHGAGGSSSSSSSSLPTRLTKTIHPNELEQINQELQQMSLDDVMQWAHSVTMIHHHHNLNENDEDENSNPDRISSNQAHHHPLVDVSSFGLSGTVILHKLDQLGYTDTVPVITIDTLHLFPETDEFIRQFKQESGTNVQRQLPQQQQKQQHKMFSLPLLQIYQPKGHDNKAEFDKEYGTDLYKTNPEKYAYLSKVEPTLRALQEHQARMWITGRRRSQGGERDKLPILEIDDSSVDTETDTHSQQQQQRFKLNPLAYWSYDDVWHYIRKHKVPYNPLHDEGYKSIGDTMTTQPVDGSADERSGRFVGMSQTECGIHSTRTKIKKMLQEAEAAAAAAAAASGKTNNKHSDSAGSASTNAFVGGSNSQAGAATANAPNAAAAVNIDQAQFPCSGCLELDPKGLQDILVSGTTDLLIEFYSPLCGHCRQFAPTYDEVAKSLFQDENIQVARFDITYHDIPPFAQQVGLIVQYTPTLFLVRRLPELKTFKFESTTKSTPAILRWVRGRSMLSR